jgi:flagellar hook-basal body complex protein FliE
MPIDPTMAAKGLEWSVGQVGGVGGADTATGGAEAVGGAAGGSAGSNFGGMLTNAIEGLQNQQVDAAQASQGLAAGTISDPTEVVMAIERARLSMQLAGQIRTKATEAYQTIFQTQV